MITVALNQKLSFGKQLIDLAAEIECETITDRNRQHALLDSVVQQLRCAARFCVCEFAEQRGHTLESEHYGLAALLTHAQTKIVAAEFTQWQDFLRDENSWLSQLMAAAENPLILAESYGAYSQPSSSTLIATESKAPIDQVRDWYSRLFSQIEHWRAMAEES